MITITTITTTPITTITTIRMIIITMSMPMRTAMNTTTITPMIMHTGIRMPMNRRPRPWPRTGR